MLVRRGPLSVAALGTPTFVSNNQGPSTETTAVGTPTGSQCVTNAICTPSADPILSGNSVVVTVTYGFASSQVPTVTDDQGDTLTHVSCEGNDSASTPKRWVDQFYLISPTAGARTFKATFPTTVTNAQMDVWQGQNLGSYDTCSSNAGTSATTFTAGSLTSTANNDMHIMSGTVTNPATVPSAITVGSQAGITWRLRAADRRNGFFLQDGIQATSGALNPQLTVGSSSSFVAIDSAFKPGSNGSQPTGTYIACMGQYNSATGRTSGNQATFVIQIPCGGLGSIINVDVNGGIAAGTNYFVTGVPSDGTNTWKQCGISQVDTIAETQDFYISGATLTDGETVTFTMTGGSSSGADMSFWWYVLAPSSLVGTCLGQSGEGTTSSSGSYNLLAPTPQASAGFAFAQAGQLDNTAIASTAPTGAAFDLGNSSSCALGGPCQYNENNFAGHLSFTNSLGAQTWSVTTANSVTIGNQASMIATFPATSAVAVYPPTQAQGGSGTNLVITYTQQVANNPIVVGASGFVSGGFTISKVCLDGNTTCSTGTQFTQLAASAVNNTSTGNANAVWYLFAGASAGSHTATIVYSKSISNREGVVYEVANISATDGGNTSTGTGATTTLTGPSVTTTGNPGFCLSIAGVSNQIATPVPAPGNEFTVGGDVWSTTTDGYAALMSSSAAAHNAAWSLTGTNNYAIGIGCFK